MHSFKITMRYMQARPASPNSLASQEVKGRLEFMPTSLRQALLTTNADTQSVNTQAPSGCVKSPRSGAWDAAWGMRAHATARERPDSGWLVAVGRKFQRERGGFLQGASTVPKRMRPRHRHRRHQLHALRPLHPGRREQRDKCGRILKSLLM